MRVAVVGAGFAGLAVLKVLRELGHEVVVFEKAPDVGGVWSRTRRYSGLTTQNNKDTYTFSDHPMPAEYPEWPSGAQVQAYLEAYVRKFGLGPSLRLSTEVVRTEPTDAEDGWLVTVRPAGGSLQAPERFDHLVVANGIFSDPVLPKYEGYSDLVRHGGRLLAPSQLNDITEGAGRHVLVVGYGKSACDIATSLGPIAASTRVVARSLLWKMPKKIGRVLNFKYLLLTRLGEGLFRYITPVGIENFLHGRGRLVTRAMIGSIATITTRQLTLRKLGLVPHGVFTDIARQSVSLVSDQFFEQIRSGKIVVHRDTVIERFVIRDGRPYAKLSDGHIVPADLVVCGTGWHQRVPFLDQKIQKRLLDDDGNFHLWRQILPHDVPNLTFNGYNSSYFSPLSAEAGALWIGAHLAGKVPLPPLEERRELVEARLRWTEERTQGHHARGTCVIPFSMHNVDETLDDIDLNVSRGVKVKQWLLPIDPSVYEGSIGRLKERLARA
ncbi:flavin-containing monooxygenase [Myceligenerans pegani]|uniref:NAD(P)/FAD-dependent oxidoreductase n=1 Tax=Myceligenerans pegani TaxID=2776917 RepID=A0ABR9N4F2_9MICO|nr:NAD(P)/FAD-dependent oxidoreductase [Myceligenerans sp. TRM 65318]MBE1878215.1 NAD(P)/FAD-dependent oxidoreductase [Myceligenerans sp. TRM 65318]MBE3020486.1 NAD(P)/FAD-dependent oxidoreductase [Myceligenerans sp. TRM 65318]